jgi:hypothetical protein
MMTMQRLCQRGALAALVGAAGLCTGPAGADELPVHNYPTVARVEFVQDCIARHGGKLENLYQCSCAIDRIANSLSYDEFVDVREILGPARRRRRNLPRLRPGARDGEALSGNRGGGVPRLRAGIVKSLGH